MPIEALRESCESGLGLCQSFSFASFSLDTEISLSSPWLHTLGNTELLIVIDSSCIRIHNDHNKYPKENYTIFYSKNKIKQFERKIENMYRWVDMDIHS
jgi:hypothetical protein